jgi:hypothetical protein
MGNTFKLSHYKISSKMNIKDSEVCKNAKNTICKQCTLSAVEYSIPPFLSLSDTSPYPLCITQAVIQAVPVTGVWNTAGEVHDNGC